MRAVAKPGPFGLTGGWAEAVWVVNVLSVLALAFGLVCVNGFGSNLLAEAVGIAAGIPIALAFLSRLGEEQRRVQWQAVCAQIGRSVATIVHEMTFEIYSKLPWAAKEHARDPVLIPDAGVTAITDSLAGACHEAARLPTQDNAASRAYEAVEPTLTYLSDVLAPTVGLRGAARRGGFAAR